MQELTPQQIEQKKQEIWLNAYNAYSSNPNCNRSIFAMSWADDCVLFFEQRFLNIKADECKCKKCKN